MPGSRFKEFIDRAFLGNRGYDYKTGQWNRQGVTEGLIGGIGNAIVPGAGTLGRFIYDRTRQPTQTLNTGGGYNYTPDFGGLNAPDFNIRGGYGPGNMPAGWDGTGGDVTFTNLNPGAGYTPPDWSSYLQNPDLTIKTDDGNGSGGGQNVGQHGTGGSMSPTGHTTNGGGGMYTSGTLSGGYAVDPSQWGAFGIGGDGGPQDSTGYYQSISTRMSDPGGGVGAGSGLLGGLLARRRTGNTGIVPPSVQTGGGLPAQSVGAFTGGGLPAYLRPPVKPGGGGQISG
jgi:hypothetical protein